jgi:hypothetical protein
MTIQFAHFVAVSVSLTLVVSLVIITWEALRTSNASPDAMTTATVGLGLHQPTVTAQVDSALVDARQIAR